MDAARLQILLDAKLEEHGLAAQGWTGELDAALRRFGVCIPQEKQIRVSRHLAALNPEAETLDTILHEIAHALAYIEHGADCGHDARWQAIAARVGARPQRAVKSSEVTTVAGAYFLVHRETGEVFRPYHRRPQARGLSTAWIPGRKAETEGKLAIVTARELAVMQAGGADLDEESGERAEFAMHAPLFGLTPDDFGRSFLTRRGRFTLVGLAPRNRKYPVIARAPGGDLYKFPAAELESLE